MKITPEEKAQLEEILAELEKHWTPAPPDPSKIELLEDDQHMVALCNLNNLINGAEVGGVDHVSERC